MRITNAYMRLLNETLAEHLPVMRRAITAERSGMRRDDNRDIMELIAAEFLRIRADFESKSNDFLLEAKLLNMSDLARSRKIREWKNIIKKSLGVNIMEDYYLGEFFREQLSAWTTANVNLIKTIPKDTLLKMQYAVEEGFTSGMITTDIGKRIQEIYGVDKRRAQFIARDQIAKLNADLTKMQQQDAGISEYIWSTSDDKRVRRRHRELDGTRQNWNDPPIVDEKTGRHGHPGQDFQCRCVALPVFNLPELNLPWEGGA